MTDPKALYANFLRRFLALEAPITVVCDASNGSSGEILKKLESASFHLIVVNEKPDGDFPAHGPNPFNDAARAAISGEVKRWQADFGALFDADGDRVVFFDNHGVEIPADEAGFLMSSRFSEPYLLDVRIGQIFKDKKIVRSPVGHYFIKKIMKKKDIAFGLEASGHYYFKFDIESKAAYFDAGIRALIEMGNAVSGMRKNGTTLAEHLEALPRIVRSGELNFKIEHPEKLLEAVEREYKKKGKLSRQDGLTVESADGWRMNLRASNTEPVLRLNMESLDPKRLQEELSHIKSLIIHSTEP